MCCYHTLAEVRALRAEVNALNLGSTRPDPFSTFEFIEAFLTHDEPRSTLRSTLWFLTAVRGGRLVGYVALSRERRALFGLQCSTIGFAVTHDTDRPHVVAKAEDVGEVSDAFLRYLLERKLEWGLLEFQQQDNTSSIFPPPSSISRDGLAVRQWPSLANGTIQLRWPTFAVYLDSLTKKSRSNARRQLRSLLAAGIVEVLTSSDPSVTPVLLDLYRSVEPRSWKFTANATIGRHPSRIAYFQALLEPQQPMRVSIHLLLLDGIPVAGLICGSFQDGLYALHIIYDASLAAHAPGSLMLLMGIRHAIETRASFFNLLSGFGYFKVQWLATMTDARTGQIYRVARPLFWRRVVGDLVRRVLRPAATAVQFNPARRAVRTARAADVQLHALAPGPARVTVAERERLEFLTARARRGRTETVSGSALSALWPKDRSVAAARSATPAPQPEPPDL